MRIVLTMAFSTTALEESSEEHERGELHKSMKESEMLSFTFTRTASQRFRMRLPHIVDAVLATNSWHRAPATKRRLTLWLSLHEERAMDLVANVYKSIQEVALWQHEQTPPSPRPRSMTKPHLSYLGSQMSSSIPKLCDGMGQSTGPWNHLFFKAVIFTAAHPPGKEGA